MSSPSSQRARIALALAFGGMALAGMALGAGSAFAEHKINGEIEFVLPPKPKALRMAGVWVDGQYVGYISELKDRRLLTVLPGQHEVTVREAGYTSFQQQVTVPAGGRAKLYVVMKQDDAPPPPQDQAQIRIVVRPGRAAVFVDEQFEGPASEFSRRAVCVRAGVHSVRIALVGYQEFYSRLNLAPGQRYTIKKKLFRIPTNPHE